MPKDHPYCISGSVPGPPHLVIEQSLASSSRTRNLPVAYSLNTESDSDSELSTKPLRIAPAAYERAQTIRLAHCAEAKDFYRPNLLRNVSYDVANRMR